MTQALHSTKKVVVDIRPTWADEWLEMPRLEPIGAKIGLNPTRDTAQMRWWYGKARRLQEATPDLIDKIPESFKGYFVRIRPWVVAGGDIEAVDPYFIGWIDRITDDQDGPESVSGSTVYSGTQTLHCRSFDEILYQCKIDGAWMEGTGDDAVEFVDMPIAFNHADSRGQGLATNRSTIKYTTGVGFPSSYVFASYGFSSWTVADIAEYILAQFGPRDVRIVFDPTALNAPNLADVVDSIVSPRNLGEAFDALFSRQRGHSWRISVVADVPTLEVLSVFDEDISVPGGSVVFDKNALAPITLTSDGAEVDKATYSVHTTMASRYDVVEVTGEPLWVCGSVSVAGSDLLPDWTDAEADAYTALRMESRTSEDFAHVFRRFILSASTQTLFGGSGAPSPFDDGTVSFAVPAEFYRSGKPLQRQVPFSGVDLSAATVDLDSTLPLLRPSVFMQVENYVYQDAPDLVWCDLSKLTEVQPGAGNVSVRMRDDELGFFLHAPSQDFFGGDATDADSALRGTYYSIDDLVATVSVRTDQVLRVRSVRSGAAETTRRNTLTIRVPGAEYWCGLLGTVLGVDPVDPTSLVVLDDNVVLRDDSDRLRAVSALASWWYHRERKAVSLSVPFLYDSTDVPVGAILAGVSYTSADTVESVLSGVDYVFTEPQQTRVTSDYAELDFTGMSVLFGRGSAKSGVSPTTRRQETASSGMLPGRQTLSDVRGDGGVPLKGGSTLPVGQVLRYYRIDSIDYVADPIEYTVRAQRWSPVSESLEDDPVGANFVAYAKDDSFVAFDGDLVFGWPVCNAGESTTVVLFSATTDVYTGEVLLAGDYVETVPVVPDAEGLIPPPATELDVHIFADDPGGGGNRTAHLEPGNVAFVDAAAPGDAPRWVLIGNVQVASEPIVHRGSLTTPIDGYASQLTLDGGEVIWITSDGLAANVKIASGSLDWIENPAAGGVGELDGYLLGTARLQAELDFAVAAPEDTTVDGTADVGTSDKLSRSDHVHVHGDRGVRVPADDMELIYTAEVQLGTAPVIPILNLLGGLLQRDKQGHIITLYDQEGVDIVATANLVPTPSAANLVLTSKTIPLLGGIGYEWSPDRLPALGSKYEVVQVNAGETAYIVGELMMT